MAKANRHRRTRRRKPLRGAKGASRAPAPVVIDLREDPSRPLWIEGMGPANPEAEAIAFDRIEEAGYVLPPSPDGGPRPRGLYRNYPYGPEDQEALEGLVAFIRDLEGDEKLAQQRRIALDARLRHNRWRLKDADAVRLSGLDESSYFSGEALLQLSPELAVRNLLVGNALRWAELHFGYRPAVRWLRDPDVHPMFGGVVPMEELAQPELLKLYVYACFVRHVYAPNEEWAS